MEQAPVLKPLSVTVNEACRVTGISRSKLYLLIGEGRVKTKKIGARTLVIFASLEALLEEAA
jgi:excisionase family DNA binding protein